MKRVSCLKVVGSVTTFFSVVNLVLYLQIGGSDDIDRALEDHDHGSVGIFDRMKRTVNVNGELFTPTPTDTSCTYWKCVDVYRCSENEEGRVNVYIYDIHKYQLSDEPDTAMPAASRQFLEILSAIIKSPYFTPDPEKACLFIPPIDMLNRQNFDGQTAAITLASLKYWNNGTNHILFNMLPGVPPDYQHTLDFPVGNAIIAGGGFSQRSYRQTFDVSIPLYNPTQKDEDFSHSGIRQKPVFLISSQVGMPPYLFDVISKLSKERSDVIVLSACRQGGDYYSRCDQSNRKHSYPPVLTSAVFCLITRSNRLATTTIHDTLRAGCIPVITMDTYVMPFSEKLDWKRAAVFINEKDIPAILTTLQDIMEDKNLLVTMQEQGKFFYDKYLSSLEALTSATLDIINERVIHYKAKTYAQWNRPPVPQMPHNPFFVPLRTSSSQGFTAVILTYNRVDLMLQVVANLIKAHDLSKIIVVWNNVAMEPPADLQWPATTVPIKVIQTKRNVMSNRFYPYKEIETDCVLSIDDDINMVTPEELEFGYRAWQEFPDRLVGYPPRVHSYNNTSWKYESEWMSNISMVLTGAAFYHKYYHYLYTTSLPGDIKEWVDENMNCEDIAMNYLITNITGKAPIKLLARKKFKVTAPNSLSAEILTHLVARNVCMQKFTDAFGMMPLRSVEFRADPVLYKEPGVPDEIMLYKSDGSL